MSDLRYLAIRAAFEGLWASHLLGVVRSLSSAKGVIFTLHRVVPEPPAAFAPNAILQVTPHYLDFAIKRVRRLGYETVSIDEALRRVASRKPQPKFAVFTFDDAYRDNLQHALPVLRRNRCPFVLYVPTAFVDGVGEVWWQGLEDIVAAQRGIAVSGAGDTEYLPTGTLSEKQRTYKALYWQMRAMPERERVDLMRELAGKYGLDLERHCRELVMDWAELSIFAKEPLCTIGAHTVHHYELSKLPAEQVVNEIEQSRRVIRAQFGTEPAHFSYPLGGPLSAGEREFGIVRDLGFASAVTTRPGALYQHSAAALHALPRISLNGRFQARRYFDVLATGALFSLRSGARP